MQDEYVKEKSKAVGKVIRELRTAKNLTQQTLAQLAEVDWSNLQKVEGGKNTTIDTLVRICIALGIKEHLLFDYAWNKNKKAEFEQLLETTRKNWGRAVANSSQCEGARNARHVEEKTYLHSRSCRGGQRWYNKSTIKNFQKRLIDTKVVVLIWEKNLDYLDVG